MHRLARFFLLFALAAFNISAAAERRAQVKFKTTEGNIVVELYNETPLHRDNFITKVRHKAFNGTLFHRVINQFMIQGGDPTSKNAAPGQLLGEGDGGPSEWISPEIRIPQLYHERGALAAAREGDSVNPDRKSSDMQFYIVTGRTYDDAMLAKAQQTISEWTKGRAVLTEEMKQSYRTVGGAPHLDGSYTVFGRVVEGMDIVDRIQTVETDRNDRPLNDIRILKAKVIKKAKKNN